MQNYQNRKSKALQIRVIIVYILAFSLAYWLILQIGIGRGLPEEFYYLLCVIAAGIVAQLVTLVASVVIGSRFVLKK